MAELRDRVTQHTDRGLPRLCDNVLGYCFDDELEDWLDHQDDPNHIFLTLIAIEKVLDPMSYSETLSVIEERLEQWKKENP